MRPSAFPDSRVFGRLPTGEVVTAYTLRGLGGLVVECLDYGGIVTRLLAPDREGRLADVVLGCDTLAGYLAPQPYLGAIIGRVAGRVPGARIDVDGETFVLPANDPPNCLHGGACGFDKRMWNATPGLGPDGSPFLRLERTSPDGEEGFPGTVRIRITYTVCTENTFLIATEAETDAPGPLSLAHHGYFNLGGHDSGSVADHTLVVHSDAYAPVDAALTPLGRREPVLPANDFRSARLLGEAMPRLFQRHGDLYYLPPSTTARRVAAVLAHPASGRVLTVSTTEDCLQIYTGECLGREAAVVGKGGCRYVRNAGLCLECQGFPGGAGEIDAGDILLRPGRPLRRSTAYAFSLL